MVMSQLCRFFVPIWVGERQRGGEVGRLGKWRGIPATFNGGSTKFGFHNRGVQWDAPMARWAGEGKDWIKLVAQLKPRREDVIRSLRESMKQVVAKQNGLQRDQPVEESKRPASP